MSPAPLIVFGEDWGRHPSSTQHLVTRLARDRRVLWVNSLGLRRPRLDRRDLGRVARKLKAAWASPTPAVASCPRPEGLSVVDAKSVSWPGSRLAERLNRHLVPRSLLSGCSDLGAGRPIVWASLPTAEPVIDLLDPAAVVYYAGDDFSALAGVDHGPVRRLERRLVGRADLVMAASETIAAGLDTGRARVLHHGCDIDLFGRDGPRAPDLPDDRPVAGFYGSLSDWIDVDLLAGTARRLPHWRLFLIGEVRTDVSALAALPNVTLAGPRPHGTLATYSRHWTASLLPFRDNAQIAACNPLKLREYLAAGRPVISTVEFAALAPYRPFVAVASGGAALAAALEAARSETGEAVARRTAAVAGESWDDRALTVSRWLDELA